MFSPIATGNVVEILEPRIAPAADLIAEIIGFGLPGGKFLTDKIGTVTAVPEEAGTVYVKITNDGDTPASNVSGIHVYLSANTVFNGEIVDHHIGRYPDINFGAFGPGEFRTFSVRVEMPQFTLGVANIQPGPYHLLAFVDPRGFVPEADNNNNTDASTGLVNYALQFGEVDGRKNVALHVFDLDETSATFRLTGGGTGTLTEVAGNTANLSLANTTAKSALSASTAVGKLFGVPGDDRVEIQNINVPTPLLSASMPKVNVTGNMNFGGGVNIVSLGDIGDFGGTNQLLLSIGDAGADETVALNFKRVGDLDLTSQTAISLLSVTDWKHAIGGATNDQINAPFISLLNARGDVKLGGAGDFEPNLTLTGENKAGLTLGLTTIKGTINSATWIIGDPASPDADAVDGKVGMILAGGAEQWKLDAEGPVAGINVKGDFLTNGANSPDLRARFFGTLNFGGTASPDITATGAAPDQRAIKMLTGGSFGDVEVSATKGGINLINVDEWSGGLIKASWIGSLLVTGNIANGISGRFSPDLDLFGVDLPGGGLLPGDFPRGITKSLGTALIKGEIDGGTWNVDSHIGLVNAGSSDPAWVLNGAADNAPLKGTTVQTLMFKEALEGNLTASAFGAISTKTDLRANITATHVTNDDDFYIPTIKSIAAAHAEGIAVFAQGGGGINSIRVGDWVGGSIRAGWVGTITTTGDTRDPQRVGNFSGDILLDGLNSTAVLQVLRSLAVKGSLIGTKITGPSDRGIGLIKADEWSDGKVDAAYVNDLSLIGDPDRGRAGDLTLFTAMLHAEEGRYFQDQSIGHWSIRGIVDFANLTLGGSSLSIKVGAIRSSVINATGDSGIGEFIVMGVKDYNGFLFDRTNITAPGMGTVEIRDVNPADTGTPYGITVTPGSIKSYTRFEDGAAVLPKKVEIKSGGVYEKVGDYVVDVT